MPSTIKEIKKKHESRLLQLTDVISVGIGKDDEGNPAIMVGLRRRNPQTESRIPERLEGYPVKVRRVGDIKAL